VIRNQISPEQDGQERLVELLRAERLASKRGLLGHIAASLVLPILRQVRASNAGVYNA
jgi:hypothetical protein